MKENRATYVETLRSVASLLERNPSMSRPTSISDGSVSWAWYGDNASEVRENLRAAIKGVGGKWRKNYFGDYLSLCQQVGNIFMDITVIRSAVCTRVVIGTKKKVIHHQPIEARDYVPPRTEVVEVDDVKWECQPVMRDVGLEDVLGE